MMLGMEKQKLWELQLKLGSVNQRIMILILSLSAHIRITQLVKHQFGFIYPHDGLLHCSDTFPGTISDKDITEQCEVLDKVNKGKVVLTDKGFDIADLCHKKGILHNRPPLKFDCRYEQADISKNFDVATPRIYNENFIGRMRDWTILKACRTMNRIDLLGYCFKIFAHVVNILKTPVGPKESVLS